MAWSQFDKTYQEIMQVYWPCIAGKKYEGINTIEVMFQFYVEGHNIYLPFVHKGVKVEIVDKYKWNK